MSTARPTGVKVANWISGASNVDPTRRQLGTFPRLGWSMRNRILQITRSSIPYVKEIMPLAKTVAGCILMQQLDYWFERYPNGFYKYLEPAHGQAAYKEGESWHEELGFSAAEFRTAFDNIGVRYKSRTEHRDASGDKFQGKFYISVVDRVARLTYYYRNHDLIDSALDALIGYESRRAIDVADTADPMVAGPRGAAPHVGKASGGAAVPGPDEAPSLRDEGSQSLGNQDSQFPRNEDPSLLGNEGSQSLRSEESAAVEIQNLNLSEMKNLDLEYTETTFTNTTQRLQLPQAPVDNSTRVGQDKLAGSSSSNKNQQKAKSTSNPNAESPNGGPTLFDAPLIYPPVLNGDERKGLDKWLSKCPYDKRQAVLDECAGAIAKGSIRMGVPAFARSLVRAVTDDSFTPSLGIEIAEARRTRVQEKTTRVAEMARLPDGMRDPSSYTDAELARFPIGIRTRMLALREASGGGSAGALVGEDSG
ncbi:hypothetical protein [Burkholderia sp. MBR-1]|uniref:hypothetical protein n=1 Tax=Burkholderia sp. MBR-1 TaxID=2732364 RepID=UPI0015EF1D98|nr:hypothetical protein [Burkholderia sp. MBR-1]QMI49705.1 hypothetical protein MBR110_29930 [Burkholderia sp. MBR-1]